METKPIEIEKLMALLSDESKIKEETEEIRTKLPKENPDTLMADFQRMKIEQLKEDIESLKQDREQRKRFSRYIFIFMCCYMSVSLVAVFLKGFGITDLSDGVIISLMTTSLASVIGIFNFVAKYLFHPRN